MDNNVALWSLLLILAFFIGFVANRTTLCAVRAVEEVINNHQAKLLMSFFRVMLWSLVISILVALLFEETALQEYNFTVVAIVGGLLFGLGATINGGCALHTLVRLGTGDMGMLLTILGLTSGAILTKQMLLKYAFFGAVPKVTNIPLSDNWQLLITIILLTILLFELVKYMGSINIYKWCKRVFSSKYDLRTSAAILGISNGILFTLIGPWMYTNTIIQSITNQLLPNTAFYQEISTLLWLLLMALLAGIMLSSLLKKEFQLLIKPNKKWLFYLLGGMFMGAGAMLIPGGNDALLMSYMPSFSPHAFPAYFAILIGIGISSFLAKTGKSRLRSNLELKK